MTQSNSSKKNQSLNNDINKSKDNVDRGFNFILNGGKKNSNKQIPEGGIKMNLDIVLALALPGSILFLLVGGIIGWTAREYMMNYQEIPRPHPEMFDTNGNLVPDEIVAFRFENYDENDSEEYQ